MRSVARQVLLIASIILTIGSLTQADWFNPAWPFRRALNVEWDAEHAGENDGDESKIAVADFYTGSHALADGADIRVATKDGRLCPARVLKSGPDDDARMVFELAKLEKNYFVYWGNARPDPLPSNIAAEVPIHFGVLFESRGLDRGNGDNIENLERAWTQGKPSFGGQMIARPFIGYNPCTSIDRTVERLTGSIFAPADGEYQFAGACDDRGSLYIDGKPLLFMPGAYADTRFNTTINLTRGRHEFLMYHVNIGGPMIISLGWKLPGAAKVDVIGPEAFGTCARAVPGPLEEIKKTLTPDFTVEHIAETFEHDPSSRNPEQGNYSQLCRFKAIQGHDNAALKMTWDFGDGQTATGPAQDHVFMTEGVYPVKLTYKLGDNLEAQENRIRVERDQSQGNLPQTNDPPIQSKVIAQYSVDTMPESWLPWAAMLHLKAGDTAAMIATAGRLASLPKHADVNQAFATLTEVSQAANETESIEMWQKVPVKSDLQPRAIKLLTDILLWNQADFAGAVNALGPFAGSRDVGIVRRQAEAFLFAGKVDEAKKLFATLHTTDPSDRAAAISGAMARTVEYFMTERDARAGADAWDAWQNRFPESFPEGYSVLLRVKLMNLDHHPAAAATVAEAFARAVPTSSYAPQLLDQASKLLAASDAAKSESLHALLKERYPEDPLSN